MNLAQMVFQVLPIPLHVSVVLQGDSQSSRRAHAHRGSDDRRAVLSRAALPGEPHLPKKQLASSRDAFLASGTPKAAKNTQSCLRLMPGRQQDHRSLPALPAFHAWPTKRNPTTSLCAREPAARFHREGPQDQRENNLDLNGTRGS